MNWDELRVELGKDEYAHVKEELLRMRTMHVRGEPGEEFGIRYRKVCNRK